jgi:hypothetical protein
MGKCKKTILNAKRIEMNLLFLTIKLKLIRYFINDLCVLPL